MLHTKKNCYYSYDLFTSPPLLPPVLYCSKFNCERVQHAARGLRRSQRFSSHADWAMRVEKAHQGFFFFTFVSPKKAHYILTANGAGGRLLDGKRRVRMERQEGGGGGVAAVRYMQYGSSVAAFCVCGERVCERSHTQQVLIDDERDSSRAAAARDPLVSP
jgi:hypothetical protein